jgi:hypothetical protein
MRTAPGGIFGGSSWPFGQRRAQRAMRRRARSPIPYNRRFRKHPIHDADKP